MRRIPWLPLLAAPVAGRAPIPLARSGNNDWAEWPDVNLATLSAYDCIPGPDDIYVADPDDVLLVNDGVLEYPGGMRQATSIGFNTSYDRKAGLAGVLWYKLFTQSNYPYASWNTSKTLGGTNNDAIGAFGSARISPTGDGALSLPTGLDDPVDNDKAAIFPILHKYAGGLLVVQINNGPYKLRWRACRRIDLESEFYFATRYGVSAGVNTSQIEAYRMAYADLVADGHEEWGHRDLAPDLLVADAVVGNSCTTTPDCLVRYVHATIPTGSPSSQVAVRRVESANSWVVRVDQTGDIVLTKVEDSATTDVASWNGMNDGDVVDVLCVGDVITIYVNGTARITHTSSFLNTATDVRVNNEGGGGDITILQVFTVDGVYNADSANCPGTGVATGIVPRYLVEGDTWNHDSDFLIDFQLDALPATFLRIAVRYVDDNNFVEFRIDSAGNFSLRKTVGGADTFVFNAGAVLSGGERIMLFGDGSDVRGYYGAYKATLSAGPIGTVADHQDSEGGGLIHALGGAQLSLLVAMPGVLKGKALRALRRLKEGI